MTTSTDTQRPHVIVADDASITFQDGDFTLEGTLVYEPATDSLVVHSAYEAPEVLTVSLLEYGFMTDPGEVFVKDWSEHSGLAQALIDAGYAQLVDNHFVGPFRSRAVRLRIIHQ